MQANMVPTMECIYYHYDCYGWFQQDNATSHGASTTCTWFEEYGIDLLGFPATSPDLNPTENVFGTLARHVHANNRQFQTVQDLKNAITEAWALFDQEQLSHYVQSMHKRMVEVILKSGKSTHY
jgi:hypothetical protein